MNEQQLKEAFMQYLQLKSGAQTQQEFEAYIQQLGEEGLQQEYAQFMQMMQQQLVAARKFGGMLNYVGKLRGICPEGYEMQFFKQGGQICKKCIQKAKMEDGGKTPQNPVDAFKCGRKMKKKACGGTVKEAKCGTKVEMDKCGKKMKKKACGGSVERKLTGGTVKTVKTETTYPNRLENNTRTVLTFSDGTQAVQNAGWGSDGMWRASYRGRQGEFGNTAGTPKLRAIADSLQTVDWGYDGPGARTVPSLPLSREQATYLSLILRKKRNAMGASSSLLTK